MNRRSFLENICKASAGVVIGGSLIDLVNLPSVKATSRRTTSANGVLDVREVPINLADTPELKPVGGTYHLTVDDLEREILVVHTAKDKFVAVDIKCTHRACDLNYESSLKRFVCPCHGAEFDLIGGVVKGPATKSLSYYHAELKGDEVIVTVYGPNDTPPANCIPPAVDTSAKAMPSDSGLVIPVDSTKN
jgi:Rieske Fe-S protein